MSYALSILLFGVIYLLIFKLVLVKKDRLYVLKFSVFYLYLMAVFFVTILPLDFTPDFKWQYHPSIEFVYIHTMPFNDLILGHRAALKEIILNIIMTIPFGLLYPTLCKKVTLFTIIKNTFILSFSIEATQLLMTIFLLHHRSCDVTDLITNVLGGIIGYTLFKLFKLPLNQFFEWLNNFFI